MSKKKEFVIERKNRDGYISFYCYHAHGVIVSGIKSEGQRFHSINTALNHIERIKKDTGTKETFTVVQV